MEMFGRWKWNGEAERRIVTVKKTRAGREYNSTELFYRVSCSCGSNISKWVSRGHLVRGNSRSCGCYQREMNAKRFSKNCKNQWNGKKNNELYAIYNAMHQRCENKKSTGYPYYGARGIKICDLWNRKNPDGFKNFCEYVGNRPSQDHSIDRINNDGDYEPGNVRWSTIKEQLQNRRELPKNRKVFVDEPPGKFGNWTFKGEVVRVIDAKGRWFRYYKVICGLCNTEHLVIKQSLKNGKSTKCLECARKALYNLNGMKRAEKT